MKPKPRASLSDLHCDDPALVSGDHLVLVVDDDRSILTSLEHLLTGRGFRVRLHATAEDFFHVGLPEGPACLLLDNQLGDGMTGVEVHAELQRLGWDLPTVFVTGHWSTKSVVHAMRTGADDFLTKPYDPEDLVAAVTKAMQRAITQRRDGLQVNAARARAATLTKREIDIVRLLLAGSINKEIADQLDISVVTVKVHRGRAMRKLVAGNVAELVRIATLAGLVPAK